MASDTLGYEWDEDQTRRSTRRLSGCPRRRGTSARRSRTTARDGRHRDPQHDEPVPRPSRATRSSSARARSSGPGASTAPTTADTLDRGSAHAAGDGQPALRHGRPARDAQTRRLSPAASTDTAAPTATITSIRPQAQASRRQRHVDRGHGDRRRGGLVGGVEVSTDNGGTWHPRRRARRSWSYTFSASRAGPGHDPCASDRRRAPTSVSRARRRRSTSRAQACPCSIFAPGVTGTERIDPNPVELGVRFRSDVAGSITGIRFYKTSQQHRHPHRHALVQQRNEPWHGDLLRRIRLGMAGGHVRHARRR